MPVYKNILFREKDVIDHMSNKKQDSPWEAVTESD